MADDDLSRNVETETDAVRLIRLRHGRGANERIEKRRKSSGRNRRPRVRNRDDNRRIFSSCRDVDHALRVAVLDRVAHEIRKHLTESRSVPIAAEVPDGIEVGATESGIPAPRRVRVKSSRS